MIHPRETGRPQGHEAQEAALLSLLERDRLPQTLLFHGPQGVGKATFAYQLACYLLGGGAPSDGLFGPAGLSVDEAAAPVKRVRHGSHGDLLVIEPEFSGQNQTPVIKVDAARRAGVFLSKTAAESKRRLVLIDGADALNISAANALLKIVEEPPLDAVMILIAHQPGRLLPTLLSRCRKLAFRAPDRAAFGRILKAGGAGLSEDEADALYTLAAGSPGAALELASYEALASYEEIIALFEQGGAPPPGYLGAVHKRVEKHAKSGGWPVWCRLWCGFLSRVVLAAHELAEPPVSAREAACLAQCARDRPPAYWQEALSASQRLCAQSAALHLECKHVIHSLIAIAFNERTLAA